jgi:tetratricopeptide (TPR) repeat protein
MQPVTMVSRDTLQSALASWHDVTKLGESELVNLEIVRRKLDGALLQAHQQAGRALRSELESALDELHRTYQLATSKECSFHALLYERYIACRSIEATAGLIGVARSEFYRRQRLALDALVSILNTNELRLRSTRQESIEQATGLSPIFQAPLPSTDHLIGRSALFNDLKARLLPGRTTALLGIPGVGKTSLAIAMAYDAEVLARFSDGVLWANLGIAPDPLAILQRWGRELGLASDLVNAANDEALAQQLHDRIGRRAFLIVIDDAWDIPSALLLSVGGIHCHHIITTRLLDVAVTLSGIDAPIRVEELAPDESIALLSQYVSDNEMASHGLSLESLASASGGLPLQLMLTGKLLAQALHSQMSRRFQTLLRALQDPEERVKLSVPVGPNDGVRGAGGRLSVFGQIAATEQVLTVEAQRALATLGIFLPRPRTFSMEAATAISDCSIEALDELVAFGLLEPRTDERFALHQSISEYARVRMADDGTWLRMSRWYAGYAETNESNYIALDIEWDNLQHALSIAQQRGHVPELLRTAHALTSFYQSRNMSDRAFRLLSETLGLCRQTVAPARLAKHLVLLARAALHAQVTEQAADAIREALQLCTRQHDTAYLLPMAYEIAAMVDEARGNVADAVQWYDRALDAAQSAQQIYLMPRMLVNLERLDAEDAGQRQDALMTPQRPAWLRFLDKVQNMVRIQPKLVTSSALRLWLKGVRLSATGETTASIAALREAADEGRWAADPAALVTALGYYSVMCIVTGDYATAERCAAEGLPLKDSVIFPRSIGFLYSAYALSQLYRGDGAKAIALMQEGLNHAKAHDQVENLSWLNGMASIVWLYQGDAQRAYEVAFEGIAHCHRSGLIDTLSYPTAVCGLALAHLGKFDKAWQYLKESVTDVSAFSDIWAKTFAWLCYGEGHLLAGNIDSARDCFNRSLGLGNKIGAYPHIASAQFGLAKVLLAQGDAGSARDAASQAYLTFRRLGDGRAKDVAWWLREQLHQIASDEQGDAAHGPNPNVTETPVQRV